MTDLDGLELQKLGVDGVRILLKWAEEEGWNPGPHDAEVYYATDPDGFYGYYSGGNLIAGGAIISYNGEFGFMGLFIVAPGLRHQGIGRKLWYERRNKLISRLNEGAAIGMDGVVAMQPFYSEGGFRIAFKDERFEKLGMNFQIDSHLTPISGEDLPAILDYDRQCFGYSRPRFMENWLALPGNHTFKYIEEGSLKGFAIMRKAATGYKICPLFADNVNIAEMLYRACLDSAAGEPVYLDVPRVNSAVMDLIRRYNAKYVFECARMYYGDPPDIDIARVFGITTFELG